MALVSMRGQVNHVAWRHAIAGGLWNDGVRCGSRTLNLNANPWNANGNVGVRGVSDPYYCSEMAPRRRRHPASQGISRAILAVRSNTKPAGASRCQAARLPRASWA